MSQTTNTSTTDVSPTSPLPDSELVDYGAATGQVRAEIDQVLDLREFVGRAPEQVVEFVVGDVEPVLARHQEALGVESDVRV